MEGVVPTDSSITLNPLFKTLHSTDVFDSLNTMDLFPNYQFLLTSPIDNLKEDPDPSYTTLATSFSSDVKPLATTKTVLFDHRRSKFTSAQIETLQETYQRCKYVSTKQRQDLSQSLGLTSQQIKDWFQNRRTRERRRKKKQDEDVEKKWNEYLMTLVRSIKVDSIAEMVQYMDMGVTKKSFVCPHEYFHSTSLYCPCAYEGAGTSGTV